MVSLKEIIKISIVMVVSKLTEKLMRIFLELVLKPSHLMETGAPITCFNSIKKTIAFNYSPKVILTKITGSLITIKLLTWQEELSDNQLSCYLTKNLLKQQKNIQQDSKLLDLQMVKNLKEVFANKAKSLLTMLDHKKETMLMVLK